jgi:hypothetical protein
MLRRAVFGLCFFLVFGGLMAHAGQFLDAPQYPVGTNPQAVAVADFNSDGVPDLAVVNTTSNTVSILLGVGDGTFTAGVTLTTGSSPYGIVTGKFTSSGKWDVAVTNSSANTVSIFKGNGDGTFTAASVSPATGGGPEGIAAGDFNGDGNLDLVVTESTPGKAGVLLGNGDGTFQAEVEYSTGNNPVSVVVADLNNDGSPDIAVANKSTGGVISVLLNNGHGVFGTQFQSAVGGIPTSIAAADFNNDGKLDLAVSCQPISPSFQGLVSVLIGNGLGGFAAHVDYSIGSSPGVSSSPTSVAAAATTTSGYPDLIVTAGNDNTVSVLLNLADGTGVFNPLEVRYGTGTTPYSAVVADLNGDGKNDIVVANSGSGSVSVLLGNGGATGTYQSQVNYDSGPQPNSVTFGDFNNDGYTDLAFADGDCASCTPNAVSIVFGRNDGTFGAPNTYSTLTGSETDTDTYALVAWDFNNDGNLDIAAVNNKTNNVSILLGNGTNTSTLQAAVSYPVGNQPVAIAYGDFNQDGKMDLVVANFGSNSISVLIGNGDGTFKSAVNYTVGHGPYAVARANFNSDKYPDLVVVNETDKTVGILINNGDGTFAPQVAYPTTLTGAPSSVAIGDYNGDGILDLAVGDSASQNVAILLGNGNGTFGTATKVATGANVFSLAAADFNGDGATDLAIAGQSKTGITQNLVTLLTNANNGTVSFSTPALYPIGSQATAQSQSIVAWDFNNDGATDLAVANGLSSDVSVLLNTVGTNMALTPPVTNPSYGAPVQLPVTISPSVTGTGTLTGTITFENGSTVIASPVTIANGAASITTSTLPVGANTISAIYSGNYQPHTVTALITVSQAGTTTTLTPSNPINLGQTVTFTATVCPAAGCPAAATPPSGTVTFLDGTTAVGTGTVNSSGVATSAAIALAVGTHSITASYPGDTNYLASVSPAGNQVVNALPVPAFTLAASALSPSSVTAGASSTSTITIAAMGGLSASNVTLSCAVSSTVSKAPACSVGAVSGTTATLTVTTTASTTAMAAHRSSMFYAMWFLFPATVFGTILLPKQKRNKLMMFAAILFISAGCVFQSACGGGSPKTTTTPPTNVPGTPSGAYSVTVTGTATGATTQTAGPLTLTVQ